jgi:hypothetical protein
MELMGPKKPWLTQPSKLWMNRSSQESVGKEEIPFELVPRER